MSQHRERSRSLSGEFPSEGDAIISLFHWQEKYGGGSVAGSDV
jgi:hypothetical protein